LFKLEGDEFMNNTSIDLNPMFDNVDMVNWNLAIECVQTFVEIGLSESVTYNEVNKLYIDLIDIDRYRLCV
jgi:hypothetical protein